MNIIGDNMKISIIVPIYKVEKYINQCIDSIICQTYQDLEIILVDDGSPDACPEICDKYADMDNRIIVIHKQNEGLIAARKSGLKTATGEYVCFVDGDDWIAPDMYEKISKSINKYNPDCVITQFLFAFEDKTIPSDYLLVKEYYNREDIENSIFPTMLFKGQYYRFGIFPNCWTKVFKREILQKHLYDVDNRIRMGEDIAFTYPCLMECQSIAFIDEPLYYYRQNSESMTASYDKNLSEIYFLPYKALTDKAESLGVDLSNQLPYYLLYLVNFVIRNEALKDNRKGADSTKKVLSELLKNSVVIDGVKKINLNILPLHTKLLAISIKCKSVFMLSIYLKLLRRYI